MILFAKAPVPGRVKTRLQPRVDPVRAAQLHFAFVADMLEMLRSLAAAADIELHTDSQTDAWGVPCVLQAEGDLGAKMFCALDNALANGRPKAMIVGSDAPTLPPAHLQALLAAGSDVALGPTQDGGYYAIACRRVHPEMFRGVRWSMPDALERTLQALRNCGLTAELGPPWFDVDDPGDLDALAASPFLPRHTARWFATARADTSWQADAAKRRRNTSPGPRTSSKA